MELHPYLQQSSWVERHKKENITVIAYAPLGNTSPAYQSRFTNPSFTGQRPPILISNPIITGIATSKSCTPAQVILSWNMNRGIAVIPKTIHLDRQKENLAAQEKCKLDEGDMGKIAEMAKTYGNSRFNNPCAMMGMHCYEGLDADPVPAAKGGRGI
jgi:alcohol dehydrogenase (NADP+)